MPDPTEFAITTTFLAALVVFVLTAIVHQLCGKKRLMASATESEQLAPATEESPYQPPVASAVLIPALPIGRVPTWFYRSPDLLGLGLIYLIFFGLVLTSVRAGEDAGTLEPSGLLVSIAFQFIIAGVAMSFVIRRIHPAAWLGLRWTGWRWVFLIAPATVLFMWFFFAVLQSTGFMDWVESLGVESLQDTVQLLQESNDPVLLGMMAFAAVIAAPVCEEIVFRGYFYPAAKKFAGPWGAAACSALVFAAAHGSLAALLPLFVFGLVLVIIYEKTGSLWAPIAVHFCFNGATVVIQLAARYFHIPLETP